MALRTSTLRLTLALAVLGSSCGGDNLTLPNAGEPAKVEIIRGNDQNGTVGEALGDSLVVEVTDRFRNPVMGAVVTWSAEGGGSVDPAETTTTADGRAGTARILGPQPTTYLTDATVEGLPGVTFRSTGLAARLVITSEIPAIAVSGVPLSPQPTLRLEDVDGTPIARADVIVTVQIFAGGGSLGGATTATSDADGLVAFTDLAIRGSPGTRRLLFAAADASFAPATTGPIALGVGAPTSIEGLAGDDQSATVGAPVPLAPSVVVRDADENPLGGIPVTFTVTGGGGTVSGNTPVTGSDGVATVGEWRLGPAVGENTLSAAVAGQNLSGSPVVFSATSVAGGPSAEQSTVTAAPTTIGASSGSSASVITVTVRDEFGNPVPGVEVSLSATGSGNALVQPTAATNAAGVTTGAAECHGRRGACGFRHRRRNGDRADCDRDGERGTARGGEQLGQRPRHRDFRRSHHHVDPAQGRHRQPGGGRGRLDRCGSQRGELGSGRRDRGSGRGTVPRDLHADAPPATTWWISGSVARRFLAAHSPARWRRAR